MKNDYEYVIKAIRNKDNNIIHYPAVKKLISLFKLKWYPGKNKRYENKRYEVYLHSLNINLKKSFR